MYKLKCEHCGHLNDVSSEYLTLCTNCNRKLNNSYSEWKKQNPTKTFDNYKNEVCINYELELEKSQLLKRQSKKRNTRLVIILISVGIVLGSIFTLFHFKKNELLNSLVSLTNTSDDIVDKEWEKKAYYDLHFYLETPYKLDSVVVPFPENMKPYITSSAAYAFEKKSGAFTLFLNYVEFKPEVPLNLENSIQGSISTMESQPGINDFTSAKAPYNLKGREATIVVGTLKQYGIGMKYQLLAFTDDKSLSQIIITYHDNDENAKKAANRIMKSLKLL